MRNPIPGGRAPEAIDSTGYDAIVIGGKSDDLKVLVITPDEVSFHEAEDLQGKGIHNRRGHQ